MQYSTNFNMNKPELSEQYRLSHWNDNTDIIDAEMQAIRSGTDDVMKETLLNFCYPIGSIYWSGVATNPHDLFGGTWVQIKDKFVWAKGDNDVLDATGGEKTHTLTTTEMPSHTHAFTGSAVTSGANNRGHTHSVTASGSVSVTTNPTFSGTEHSHSYTPAGTISITTNPTFTGSAVTSGAMSGNSTGSITSFLAGGGGAGGSGNTAVTKGQSVKWGSGTGWSGTWNDAVNTISHTHNVTAAGTISGGAYKFTGSAVTLKATAGGTISGGAYKFTGSAVTSNDESQNHTHSVTASGTNASSGGGEAHNNMPPYVVKYCWQRTA